MDSARLTSTSQAVVACQKMDGSRPALLRVIPEQNVSGCTAHHSNQVQHNRWPAIRKPNASMQAILGFLLQQARLCTAALPEAGGSRSM